MNWNRAYHYYLIFGDTTSEYAPWETRVWKTTIYPILDRLLSKSAHYKQTGIGSLQYIPKPGTAHFQPLKLGRLSWNAGSLDKWTLDTNTPGRRFHHLDIWTPFRGVCEKLQTSPDVFVSLFNERDTYLLTDPAFDTFTVVAVAKELNDDPLPEILQLSVALKAKKTVYRSRGWEQHQQNEHWDLVNSIQDTMSVNISKRPVDNLQKMAFGEIPFEPFWEIVYER